VPDSNLPRATCSGVSPTGSFFLFPDLHIAAYLGQNRRPFQIPLRSAAAHAPRPPAILFSHRRRPHPARLRSRPITTAPDRPPARNPDPSPLPWSSARLGSPFVAATPGPHARLCLRHLGSGEERAAPRHRLPPPSARVGGRTSSSSPSICAVSPPLAQVGAQIRIQFVAIGLRLLQLDPIGPCPTDSSPSVSGCSARLQPHRWWRPAVHRPEELPYVACILPSSLVLVPAVLSHAGSSGSPHLASFLW
jgi:hypothetical protein